MEMIRVIFQNNFHVPGFSRRRFQKGLCDVPAVMKDKLPKTARIVPDDYQNEELAAGNLEELRANDYVRGAAESVNPDGSRNATVGYNEAFKGPRLPEEDMAKDKNGLHHLAPLEDLDDALVKEFVGGEDKPAKAKPATAKVREVLTLDTNKDPK